MRRFLDTSALYAILDAREQSHEVAVAALDRLADDGLLTTDYVAVEATALVQRRLGMKAVRDLHERLLPLAELQRVPAGDYSAAVAELLAVAGRRLSLVDLTTFRVMRRAACTEAFAFDDDFRAAGFSTAP